MTDTSTVKISAVVDSAINPRRHFDEAQLNELADSIRSVGVLQAITVRPLNGGGKYEAIFGHRRLRAAALAGLEVIPANVREMSDLEVAEVQLVENIQRADVEPLEEADAYKAILDAGIMTPDDIAAKVGKSRSHVYARLRLAELGPKARKALEAGRILPSVALVLARLDGKLQEKALADVAARKGEKPLSISQCRYRLQSYTQDLRKAPFDTKDAELVPAAGACTNCPKRSGNQTDLFGDMLEEGPQACTDPSCYQEKIKAGWARAAAVAKDQGQTVLKSKDVFEGKHYPRLRRGLTLASDSPAATTGRPGRRKSWKGYLGKKLLPSVVKHPESGAVVEVYDLKAAKKALAPEDKEKLYPKKPKPKPAKAKSPKAKAKESQAEEWAVDEYEVIELTGDRIGQELARRVGQMDDEAFIRALVTDTWNSLFNLQAPVLCGLMEKRPVTRHEVTELLPAAPLSVVKGLCAATLYQEGNGDVPEVFAGLVDADAIKSAVRAELEAKAKEEAEAAKPLPPPPPDPPAAPKAPRKKKARKTAAPAKATAAGAKLEWTGGPAEGELIAKAGTHQYRIYPEGNGWKLGVRPVGGVEMGQGPYKSVGGAKRAAAHAEAAA